MEDLHTPIHNNPMKEFSCLYKEPDLPSKIFALLPPEDLCQVILICKDWRNLVINENAWRRKLKNQTSLLSWRYFLGQFNWEHLNYEASKRLYLSISSILGPDSLTPAFQERITSDRLEKPLSQATSLVEKAWLKKAQNDHNILVSNVPQFFKFPPNAIMSKLILFGPAAFPILVTDTGFVSMAGAHYGKGRLVVVAHEALLEDTALMRGVVDWCGRRPGCPFVCDPISKFWNGTTNCWEYTQDIKFPANATFLPRCKVTGDVPAYLTQGHYEDHADHLMEYVMQGGGLVVGGHAWRWTYIKNNRLWPWELANSERVCSLLEHPGNKIVNRVGIAFSREKIDEDKMTASTSTSTVPGLRSSLYYAMRCRHDQPALEAKHNLVAGADSAEFYGFPDRLKKLQYFKDIIFYIEQNFTSAFASTLSILQWKK